MNTMFLSVAIAAVAATPLLAESHVSGDAGDGERAFRQCQACHVVENEAGDVLAGRNAKTGPNLYGVAGRPAGSMDGFGYSDAMAAAGEAGLVWDEANFVAYVQDPTAFLREYLDDNGARGAMVFKVRKEEDALNLYAFLASLAPDS